MDTVDFSFPKMTDFSLSVNPLVDSGLNELVVPNFDLSIASSHRLEHTLAIRSMFVRTFYYCESKRTCTGVSTVFDLTDYFIILTGLSHHCCLTLSIVYIHVRATIFLW